jgi:hypothetical protein
LVGRLADHARAVQAYENAASEADDCLFQAKKNFPPRPLHLTYTAGVNAKTGEVVRAPLDAYGLEKILADDARLGLELTEAARRHMFADLRKAQGIEAAILRDHGWWPLKAAARKANDEMDRLENRCTQFPARSVADLAAKLQFADQQYDLTGDAPEDFGAAALASAISDAVRLAKKGGAA